METAKRYTYGYKNDTARIRIGKKQSFITFPSYVCRKVNDRWSILGIDTDVIKLLVDDKDIEVVPVQEYTREAYVFSYNGSGAGRKVNLPSYLVEKYNLKDGYYRTEVLKTGTIHVNLKERVF